MEDIKLSLQLVNAVLEYLGTKPFNEVAGLIGTIHQQAAAQGLVPAVNPQPADAPAEAPPAAEAA